MMGSITVLIFFPPSMSTDTELYLQSVQTYTEKLH
jgi:hypothetical protein